MVNPWEKKLGEAVKKEDKGNVRLVRPRDKSTKEELVGDVIKCKYCSNLIKIDKNASGNRCPYCGLVVYAKNPKDMKDESTTKIIERD